MANDKKVKKEKKHFFKDFKAELKRVTWPTGKQLVNNTIAVITIVLITAAIVFVLDLGFKTITNYGINAIKSATTSKENTVVEEENNATPESTEGTGNEETTTGQDESAVEDTDAEATQSPEAE